MEAKGMKTSNLTKDDKRAINHMIRNAMRRNRPGPLFWLMFFIIFIHAVFGR